jgi:uncharacterized protein
VTNLLHAIAAGTFAPMLGSLSNVLGKGADHAIIQGWPADRLPKSRLAPDMFTLTQQVYTVCYQAKHHVGLLVGRSALPSEDTDTTIEDLKIRILRTQEFLGGIDAAAFEGAGERRVTLPLGDSGMTLEASGLEFLRDWLLPNFYFHVTTAYDILRNNGVEIGKLDFLGHIAPLIHRDA